jgi:hypothetical protein
MKLYKSTFIAVLSLALAEAGHHRLEDRHHSKSGKSVVVAVTADSKSSEDTTVSAVTTVQSMTYTDTDDNMSIVYTSSEDTAEVEVKVESKTGKAEMMAKAEKSADKGEWVPIEAEEPDDSTHMSMSETVGSVVYTSYASKAEKEAKAAKAMEVDSKAHKASKSAHAKALKPLHSSMSMGESDSVEEDDGEWVPITTEPAITTVDTEAEETATEPPASTEVPAATSVLASTEASTGSTASPEGTQSTASAELDAATTISASTPGPMLKAFNEELFEEEIAIVKNGGHGSESHVHGKSGESVELSNKIASGNHIRPDALQSSDSASLMVPRVSIVALCMASFYALSL